MAAKFFALVALLAVGARASPVFDHSNMASADDNVAGFLEQVLNNEVQESIASFDMLRRGNASNTTGTTPTPTAPAPVPVPAVDNSQTGSTQRTQQITLSGITSAQFTNNPTIKTGIEIGYATHCNLYVNNAYVNGASCTASVTRRALSVTLTTTVPNSHLAMVTAIQTNLANDAGGSALSSLTSSITSALSTLNVTGVTISVTGAAAASTPAPTPTPTGGATTSGASQTAILSVSAIAALVLALRH